jgi:flagellar motor switch protein FliM
MTESLPTRAFTIEKLKRLINRARQDVEPDQKKQPEVADFDWYHPHHFRTEHIAALELFLRKTREALTEAFQTLCEGAFTVSVGTPTQHYASMLVANATTEHSNRYYLPITARNNHCGFLSFSVETAFIFVALMLREVAGLDNADRKLSSLEDSILMDVATTIAETFADVFQEFTGHQLSTTADFVKDNWPVSFDGLDDLTAITFKVESPAGAFEFSLTVLSSFVDPVVGLEQPRHIEESIENRRKMIMAAIDDAPVTVTARICSCSVELDDIMNLKEGDVLILNKRISQPIDVMLNQRKCFGAYPASSFGKLAVVVAERETEDMNIRVSS